MDYEKKYKEALGWMQSLYNGLHGKTKEEAEKYFPELKESEDEKIRKGIIDFLWKEKIFLQEAHSSVENNPKYRFVMDAIAWLEKQGKQNTRWKPSKEQLEALEYASDICLLHERGDYYEDVLDTLRDDLWLLV